MSSYEVEHNIPPPSDQSTSTSHPTPPPPRRPDFSSFYAQVAELSTGNNLNRHAVPIPADVAAANRLAAEGYEIMMRDDGGRERVDNNIELVRGMIEDLLRGWEMPGREVEGVGDGFLDELERVPVKSLKKTDICPICANPFLDDPYPLIVRLPCHASHIYDLECIAPWLKLHATCPLDRKDLLQGKRKREEKEEAEARRREREKVGDGREDEEEEEDEAGMYA